jgi:radical SAM-linked protein
MIVHHSSLEALEKTFSIDKKKLVCYHCGIACDLKGMVEERREFLGAMGAVEHRDYVPPAVLKKDILELREKRGQEAGFKYRIEFAKVGPITFISHLDLQKVIARVFKRAELDTLRSEGYHVRPLLSFGPALPLGISSFCEAFDVRVPTAWDDPEEVLRQLQAHAEPGLLFQRVSELTNKTPSIQDQARAFTYFIPVRNAERVGEVVAALNGESALTISSWSKKEGREIPKDIRPMLLEITAGDLGIPAAVQDLIDEVSPCKMPGILVKASVKAGSGVRPSELLELLTARGLEAERPIKVASELHSV